MKCNDWEIFYIFIVLLIKNKFFLLNCCFEVIKYSKKKYVIVVGVLGIYVFIKVIMNKNK